MKELSIEEKAQRYDEAIEKFDVILNLNTVKESGTIFADDVRKIFPELKESEDERIRKALISVLKSDFENDTTIHDISVGDILAWLEKQGEQNHTWSEEDETTINNLVWAISNDCIRPQDREDYCDWLKSLRPQPQWKPSDEQIDVIEAVINHRSFQRRHLDSLYEQLKKLRESKVWKL